MNTNEKGQVVRDILDGLKTDGCLVVSEKWEETNNGSTRWLAHCRHTGEPLWVWAQCLKSGSTIWCKSCRNKVRSEQHKTHGMRFTPEYRTWTAMVSRCTNKNHKSYHNYGGRGITVCESWMTFENFLTDMGIRPKRGFTIERINNSKGYCKENCKWATMEEQGNNRRTNVFISFNGKSQTISKWARELRMDKTTIRKRLLAGEPPERILSKISLRLLTKNKS